MSTMPMKRSVVVVCFECRQPGHLARECRAHIPVFAPAAPPPVVQWVRHKRQWFNPRNGRTAQEERRAREMRMNLWALERKVQHYSRTRAEEAMQAEEEARQEAIKQIQREDSCF